MKVLITGATGFIGQALVEGLQKKSDFSLRLALRNQLSQFYAEGVRIVQVGNISSNTKWNEAVDGCQSVIHLAARVHVMRETAVDPLSEFREINTAATINLARQAALAKVKRFIYVSSIKVNGESTQPNRPFAADDVVSPKDPYAISKYDAEQALLSIGQETGLEIVIIRPVLVYGPKVKGNFLNMLGYINRGLPLPFGSVVNKRSMVSVYNLVDLIQTCLWHQNASGQIFLVSDGEDLSTPGLLRKLGVLLEKRVPLISLPSWTLTTAASLIGKQSLMNRLCGSLQVDISKTRQLLNWHPPVKVDDALRATVAEYQLSCSSL